MKGNWKQIYEVVNKQPFEGSDIALTKPIPLYMQGKWKRLFEGRSQPPKIDILWNIDTQILIVLNSGKEPQAIYLSPEPFDQIRIASLSGEHSSRFTMGNNEFGELIPKYMGIEIYKVQTSEYHVRVY